MINYLKLILFMGVFNIFSNTQAQHSATSVHALSITDMDGKVISLSQFKGKKILFVNVASKCGFTKQYDGLQKLHSEYKDNLVVVGLPCNQFGGQEPGSLQEIKSFCQTNFRVEFLMTEKVDVKGENQHELYKWLTSKNENGVKSSSVKWNFQKYLVDEEGKLLDVFYSMTTPNSNKIIKHLK